jgi:hypothetical protein
MAIADVTPAGAELKSIDNAAGEVHLHNLTQDIRVGIAFRE